ncbi:MAG: NAD-dependent epimerase/dehydratase family protein [Rhodobacteraceae bacterium]|nr:NAD-dependent epimerase/dehydratase family protein [Paracoccaceae bacterium]
MAILVTGCAGFIGFHLCKALLDTGETVIGVDSLDAQLDARLKRDRLDQLASLQVFKFEKLDLSTRSSVGILLDRYSNVDRIVHLAAVAGVRNARDNPHSYTAANIEAHLNAMELARRLDRFQHFVYASTSAVYGNAEVVPTSEDADTGRPESLYAATKRAAELLAYNYSHTHSIAATGLRFFTVYGPWGRPDMAAYIFTNAILTGQPLPLFNRGDMRRDFTYVSDVVDGILAALARPPAMSRPHRIYNLGCGNSVELLHFLKIIERETGRKADCLKLPMQEGDVYESYSDITLARRELGYEPKVDINKGLPRFVKWFRKYHAM